MTHFRTFLALLLALSLDGGQAPSPQQPGIIIQVQSNGTPLVTRSAGLFIINCSSNVTCGFAGSTLSLSAAGGPGGSIPTGMILFISSGSCPAGFNQVS